ncbi:MAG: hypothetical protein ACOH15_08430 [Acetobacterium sp.]
MRMLSRGLVGCGIFFSLIGINENIFLIAAFGFMMFVFMPAVQIGAGRGNALLIVIAGLIMAIVGIVVSRLKSVKILEEEDLSKYETIAASCPEGL